jgi:hypothetical protein
MKMLAVLVTSALLVSLAGAASAYPARIIVPCQYPHGWNSTDASREVWGVPLDRDHRCVIETNRYRPGWGWRSYR